MPDKLLTEDHKAVLIGLYFKSKENKSVTVSDLAPLFTFRPTAIAAFLRKLQYQDLLKLSWAHVNRNYASCTRVERCRAYLITKKGKSLVEKLLGGG
jgi:hypothetical protein